MSAYLPARLSACAPTGTGPRYIYFGRLRLPELLDGSAYPKAGPGKRARVLYRHCDLEDWLDGYSFRSTSEYP
jgi:hypothetical protein